MPEMFPASGLEELVRTGGPCDREVTVPPTYKVGDKVRAKNINPRTHTRLPRYVRGHVGEIVEACGGYVFPDSSALQQGENPQHLYSVRFSSRELWGPEGDENTYLFISLWEDYLEPAE